MHVALDAVAVRPGSSAIVVEHLLRGWREEAPGDRLTVLAPRGGAAFAVPEGVEVLELGTRLPGPLGGLWLRTVGVRRATRRLRADALLCGVPASGLVGGAPRRGVILYDLRHELRPHQFSRGQRAARRVAWGWSLRRADHIPCISERTRADLARSRPHLADRAVAAPLGSDHVLAWPPAQRADPPYALAFGHFANKNADAVIAGWAQFCAEAPRWRLRLVGMGAADRAAAQEQVERLGIADRVELMPWLDDEAFAASFTAAGMVVFPSDFEGFGLPAAEALRLGIPTVVSTDPALAEVTGGWAVTARSTEPADLAAAYRAALASGGVAAGARDFVADFTWRRTAALVRAGLDKP